MDDVRAPLPYVPDACRDELRDGEFAITCELPKGHDGPHAADDSFHWARIEWRRLPFDAWPS